MSSGLNVTRRGFVRLCASAVALISAIPSVLAQPDARLRRYQRVHLVDAGGRPITAKSLTVGESYLFHYPFVATPCFLLNLGRPATPTDLKTEDGQAYRWQGGVGPERSIVAFSAICAHKMSHPARQINFINYRHERVNFVDSAEHTAQRAQVIYCCSEKSVYDPAEGARVLGGPAKQPLAAIVLEEDAADGTLYAVGTFGGEMFDRFFREFGFRLALEHGTSNIRAPVSGSATVTRLADYSDKQMRC
jgi:Rieske Fe-S protein